MTAKVTLTVLVGLESALSMTVTCGASSTVTLISKLLVTVPSVTLMPNRHPAG